MLSPVRSCGEKLRVLQILLLVSISNAIFINVSKIQKNNSAS